jgi:hypothetical protein
VVLLVGGAARATRPGRFRTTPRALGDGEPAAAPSLNPTAARENSAAVLLAARTS